ncbi:leader peptidase (prepilin peptidase)/N-methyltransferase [Ruminiclostridium sufflavum DSM 19573]|uniref:Leader peptidase (Prepilin peptidase)/N-methyltransferase n=1 Tax=Ruminiclostridium sufflavum DSM 19573 TaxID=1121337 RepID=A0A318XNM8_9FIRM|nr:A24 family peptidase [Ruminiclostridium sufflavum]PYG88521.1 leader peptidase (prepilin peptidase)/N-methyltransferase [Ruminiclostridium sufflavum DSM 19573]
MIQKINVIREPRPLKLINETGSGENLKKNTVPMAICFCIWLAAVSCIAFHMKIGIEAVALLSLVTIQFVSSINDLYNKTIPLKLLFIGIITGFVCFALLYGADFLRNSISGGVAAFLIMLIIILLSKGQVGGGDLWLMTVTGFFAGVKDFINILFVSVISAGLHSVIALIIKKADKNTEIPFAPFILFATVICMIIVYW